MKQKLPLILFILSVIITALTFSCKTRQYEKNSGSSSTSSSTQAKMDSTINQYNHYVDTTTVDSGSTDSSTTTTTTHTKIVPDSGTTVSIGPDGTIKGKVHSIDQSSTTKTTSKKQSTSHTKKAITQTDSSALKDVKVTTAQVTTKRDTTSKSGKSNSTLGANIPWYDWLIGSVVLAALVYLIIRNWKKIIAL